MFARNHSIHVMKRQEDRRNVEQTVHTVLMLPFRTAEVLLSIKWTTLLKEDVHVTTLLWLFY